MPGESQSTPICPSHRPLQTPILSKYSVVSKVRNLIAITTLSGSFPIRMSPFFVFFWFAEQLAYFVVTGKYRVYV